MKSAPPKDPTFIAVVQFVPFHGTGFLPCRHVRNTSQTPIPTMPSIKLIACIVTVFVASGANAGLCNAPTSSPTVSTPIASPTCMTTATICGKTAYPRNNLISYDTRRGVSLQECATACSQRSDCLTMGYDPTTGYCTRVFQPIEELYLQETDAISTQWYERDCWECGIAYPTTVPIATTTSTTARAAEES